MKTPEDEAFDDLARRQGGGFQAKRQMAADKLQEDLINYGTSWSKGGERIDPMSVYKEPAQEPVSIASIIACREMLDAQPVPARMQYMIEDDDDIQDYKREWVGLTDDELADLWYKESLDWMEFARAHEAALKEKNNGT
jgi:hypothetical protein